MLLPMLVYVWYVRTYGVDVIFWDEWAAVRLIGKMYRGTLALIDLWTPYGPHRMLIPNVWYLMLARIAHFNTKDDMYASVLLLVAAFATACILYRRSGGSSLWPLVPAAYLFFGLAPYENALWGFQVAWYMVLCGFLLALAALDGLGTSRPPARTLAFLAALGLATIASCSSVQGLLVWPCGLLYMVGRGYGRPVRVLLWSAAAILVAGLYLQGVDTHATYGHPFLEFTHHPASAALYFLVALGAFVIPGPSVAVSPVPMNVGGLLPDAVAGGLLLALSGALIATWIRRPDARASLSLAVACITFGLLFDATLVVGRSWLGVLEAASSRYSLYNLLVFTGCYFGLVALVRRGGRADDSALLAGMLVLVILQVGMAYRLGLTAGAEIRRQRIVAADVLVNYRSASNKLIGFQVYMDPSTFPELGQIAEAYRLSVFSEPGAQTDRAAGIVPGGIPGRLLPLPPALRTVVSTDGRARQAWTILSTIYDRRADVRAYVKAELSSAASSPGPDDPQRAPEFAKALLAWATSPGHIAIDDWTDFLRPYQTTLDEMRRLVIASES